jgi:hypothetical protein
MVNFIKKRNKFHKKIKLITLNRIMKNLYSYYRHYIHCIGKNIILDFFPMKQICNIEILDDTDIIDNKIKNLNLD